MVEMSRRDLLLAMGFAGLGVALAPRLPEIYPGTSYKTNGGSAVHTTSEIKDC